MFLNSVTRSLRLLSAWLARERWPGWAVPLCLLALTLVLFGDLLLAPGTRVLSANYTDTAMYFADARAFGFGQMRQGHLPLWNPYTFSGTPFLGSFQSALLYPPNWLLYLTLPLARAINSDIALHIFLAGLGTALLAKQRGLRPLACLLSGSLVMFGGPYFLKVYAGHLSPLDAMAWIPFILLAADLALEGRAREGALLGVFAVAMQMLAGHPQTVFNTVVTVALYVLLRLFASRGGVRRGLPVLLAMYVGGMLLSAAQLLASAQASLESTRANGAVPFSFAATFSLPPENVLTLVVPNFFGDMTRFPYWGRCYLWEMSLFVGVSGLTLAVYGACCGAAGQGRRTAGLMMLLLLLLALGAHTPLFRVLYDDAPGFNKFRGHSKFIIEASIFLALLAGMGLEALLSGALRCRKMAGGVLGVALLCFGASAWVSHAAGSSSAWGRLMAAVSATGESYLPPVRYADPAFVQAAAGFAARGLLLSGLLCLAVAVLFFFARRSQFAACVLAVLAIVEVFAFARASRTTFDLSVTRSPVIARFVSRHPGDYRILNTLQPNSGLATGAQDVWGYDPFILGRYAEFMAWTQGQNPDNATMYVHFSHLPNIYSLLRCRYAFAPDGHGGVGGLNGPEPLPHVLLVSDWTLARGRAAVFAALSRPAFDPRAQVILEAPPVPAPVPSAQTGSVRLTASGTDFLDVEADLPRPAILLVTDAYSAGWRAVALTGSAQRRYSVMPADSILRAVPLAAGHHRLRLEYRPQAFSAGVWISSIALIVYLGLLSAYMVMRRHAAHSAAAREPLP